MTCEVIALLLGWAQSGCTSAGTPSQLREEITMPSIIPSSFLKRVLLADAAVSGSVALLQLAAYKPLAALTGIPADLLLGTGIFLVCYVTLLITLARSTSVWTSMIWLVIAGNLAWAAAALAVAATLSATLVGEAFAAVHAIAVTTFACLEYRGLSASEAKPAGAARA
jgi:hypothetical protein